jgi:hypothetical protein
MVVRHDIQIASKKIKLPKIQGGARRSRAADRKVCFLIEDGARGATRPTNPTEFPSFIPLGKRVFMTHGSVRDF